MKFAILYLPLAFVVGALWWAYSALEQVANAL